MTTTTDGYEYTPGTGIRKGLSTIAAIKPIELNANVDKVYDAIVIGTGYAGLAAARDLTEKGLPPRLLKLSRAANFVKCLDTLVLEGRDRIGGRTFTVYEHGKPWELGGTWVHWSQPFVWSEIVRYGFDDKLQNSLEFHPGSSRPVSLIKGKRTEREWDDPVVGSILARVCNFDEVGGTTVFGANTLPRSFIHSEAFKKLDKLSLQDRIDELKLNTDEIGVIKSIVAMMAKGEPKDIGLSELARWFSLAGGSAQGMAQAMSTWKLSDGQAALSRAIWDDAINTGNLSYRFQAPVVSVTNTNGKVIVSTECGKKYVASKVICTIPLNVLKRIRFEPKLDAIKAEAIQKGHNNQMIKMYAEIKGKQWRNWMYLADPSPGIAYMLGEGFSKQGNSLLFTTVSNDHVEPEKNPEKACEIVSAFDPRIEIVRLLGNDWCSDRFSEGGWVLYEPGFTTKYLEKLQEPSGSVYFANSDWANMWRGFVDGAIEQGKEAAGKVINIKTSSRL